MKLNPAICLPSTRGEALVATPPVDRRRIIEPDSTQVGFVFALLYCFGMVTTVLALFL